MAIETQDVQIDGQPISVNGTVTANQGTAAAAAGSWPVEVTDGTNVLGTAAHPLRIDPTGTTTQPVSGTITANPPTSNTSSITQVVLTANTNATLLASNANRKKFIVFIPKSVTYVKYGVTASATSFTWTAQTNNATIDDTIWTGQIDIFSTQAQTVTVTELT